MDESELERLAKRLNRPLNSMQALGSLSPAQLAMLEEAIERACSEQRRNLDLAFRAALPGPLRWLVLRILRGGAG